MIFNEINFPEFSKMEPTFLMKLSVCLESTPGALPYNSINSSFRTPLKNLSVHGVFNSFHMTGEAADITFPGPIDWSCANLKILPTGNSGRTYHFQNISRVRPLSFIFGETMLEDTKKDTTLFLLLILAMVILLIMRND